MCLCDGDGRGVPLVVMFVMLVWRHLLSTDVEQNLQEPRT